MVVMNYSLCFAHSLTQIVLFPDVVFSLLVEKPEQEKVWSSLLCQDHSFKEFTVSHLYVEDLMNKVQFVPNYLEDSIMGF